MPNQAPSPVTIRTMQGADLAEARRLQRAEGWNQEDADWRFFLDSHPRGCFIATDTSNALLGTITTIRYGAEVCWIGMLLVDREVRGRGIAGELMKTAIAANRETCRSLRLDATPAGRPVYEKFGFRVDYGLERWVADAPVWDDGAHLDGAFGDVVPVPLEDLAAVLNLDRLAFGADRMFFLDHLRQRSPESARMMVSPAGDRGGPAAYALGRGGDRFRQIGPVIARKTEAAVAVFDAAIRAIGKGPVVVDIPTDRPEIQAYLDRRGFHALRPFTRMTLGRSCDENPTLVYAVAGPEFG